MTMYISSLFSVPPPVVTVTLSHTPPLYTGINLTLTCTVTLDSNVDSGERVVTEWSGLQDIPEDRYSVTAVNGSGTTYISSLTISPLAYQDTGIYTCTATVTGGRYVQPAMASNKININVKSELPSCTYMFLLTLNSYCIYKRYLSPLLCDLLLYK